MNGLKSWLAPLAAAVALAAFIALVVSLIPTGPSAEEKDQWRTPRIITSVDDCAVYKFYDHNWHYFTRCGNMITTTKTFQQSCGKGCVRTADENITTVQQ